MGFRSAATAFGSALQVLTPVDVANLAPERSYGLANLSTARRGALKFVSATKTDEEWTTHLRNGLDAAAFNRLKTSDEIAKQNADWYREVVGSSRNSSASGTVTLAEVNDAASASYRATAVAEPIYMKGQGSADAPFILDDDDDEFEVLVEPSASTDVVQAPPIELSQSALQTEHHDQADFSDVTLVEDMYCLLCKALIPASDVPRHASSISHQLSKDASFTGKAPLVPPTSYGIRSSNIGYGMLQRLGWAEDTGLGSSTLGRKTPVRIIEKFDRKGVGVDSRKKARSLQDEGKVLKVTREVKVGTARPLAKNRKELESSKRREMIAFKEGLAYLNS